MNVHCGKRETDDRQTQRDRYVERDTKKETDREKGWTYLVHGLKGI